MRDIKIGDKAIGKGQPVFVVAEAGINHDGKLGQAEEMVRMAKEAGADAVKFQTFKAGSLCSRASNYFELFKSLQLTRGEWARIAETARHLHIAFFSSVFDEESVQLLGDLGVPAFKVASGDLTYLPFLQYVAKRGKPVILSTGMSTLSEIDEALNTIYSTGNKNVILLHCVSSYPTNAEDVNLKAISILEQVFKLPVGFSDHTVGTVIPVAAVSLGVRMIEKHFTLDKSLSGPDHKLSLDPGEFKQMVTSIRMVEQALGDGTIAPRKSEAEAIREGRRSIIAKKKISAGATITREMLKITIPGTGIEPKFIDIVIGRTAKEPIQEDEVLTWDKI